VFQVKNHRNLFQLILWWT